MIRFTESFDHIGTNPALLIRGKWTGEVANDFIVSGGRCNSNCYQNNSSGNLGPHVGIPNRVGQFSWGQAGVHRLSTQDGSDDINFLEAGGTAQCFFRFKTDGSIQFWRGPNTTLGVQLATSVASIYSINTWHVFEWEVFVDIAVGTVQAWVDGVEIIPKTTGLATKADPVLATSADYTAIKVGFINLYKIDDIIFGDATDSGIAGNPLTGRLGPRHVTALLVEADSVAGGGFYKQFALSTGTDHGALVLENPPDEVAFNLSAAAVKKDTYTLPVIKIGVLGTINAVNVLPMVKKSDAMNTRTIKPMIRLSGVDHLAPTALAVPDTQYEYRWHIFAGLSGVPITVANFNAMEVGLEDTA